MTFKKYFAATVLLAAALPAAAVDISQLGLSQSQVDALNAQLTAPSVAPGVSFGSPVGFGTAWGQAYLGVGGNTLPKTANDNVDGSATVGFGIGDPNRYVGLETDITAISLRNSFGDSGNVDFKLHRVLPGRSSIAIGTDNAAPWGAARVVDTSTYAAFSKIVELAPDTPRAPWLLAMNVGVGNKRFAKPGTNGAGVFGSIAIVPLRQVSLIVDYTGRDTNAAVSMVPFVRLPVVLTLGAINLGQRYGRDTEFAGGLGYLFQF